VDEVCVRLCLDKVCVRVADAVDEELQQLNPVPHLSLVERAVVLAEFDRAVPAAVATQDQIGDVQLEVPPGLVFMFPDALRVEQSHDCLEVGCILDPFNAVLQRCPVLFLHGGTVALGPCGHFFLPVELRHQVECGLVD